MILGLVLLISSLSAYRTPVRVRRYPDHTVPYDSPVLYDSEDAPSHQLRRQKFMNVTRQLLTELTQRFDNSRYAQTYQSYDAEDLEDDMVVGDTDTDNGLTLLHIAARDGQPDVVQLLVKNPAVDVNAQDKFGFMPLHYSSRGCNYRCTEALLSHPRIKVNAKTKDGWSPLYLAQHNKCWDTVKLLLARPDIDPNM